MGKYILILNLQMNFINDGVTFIYFNYLELSWCFNFSFIWGWRVWRCSGLFLALYSSDSSYGTCNSNQCWQNVRQASTLTAPYSTSLAPDFYNLKKKWFFKVFKDLYKKKKTFTMVLMLWKWISFFLCKTSSGHCG